MPDPSLATSLLQRSQRDDDSHAAELLALVGAELRQMAGNLLRRERVGHTLQPTALLNEAYLKRVDSTVLASGERERFLALTAQATRQVLVDLDDALTRFAAEHRAVGRVVELRAFGGLTIAESAEVLGISMVNKHWRLAQAWLRRELGSAASP